MTTSRNPSGLFLKKQSHESMKRDKDDFIYQRVHMSGLDIIGTDVEKILEQCAKDFGGEEIR